MYGLANGFAFFFFPAIRRLPLHKRLSVALFGVLYWSVWGYYYGRDLQYTKSKNIMENWERDVGLRDWRTGY